MTLLSPAKRLAVFVFCSGACSLLYQVVWQREFRLIFGASTAASGAVLAAFIGGLGLGSLLLAPRIERSAQPFLLYARFELAIAITAAISPLLLEGVRAAYLAAGGTTALGSFLGTVIRVVLCALVVFIPTFFMGGTLPAVARAVTEDADGSRRGVALLYGVNTLGAVLGCAVATFFLLEVLGNRMTLWAGCGLNLVVALLAQRYSQRLPPVSAGSEAGAPASGEAIDLTRGLVLTAAFLVGAAFFLMELVWFRMLGPLLGGSVFTFGLVLCVALAGIGLGGAWAARRGNPGTVTLAAFAITCLLEAAAMALPLALGDGVAAFALALQPLAIQGLAGSAAAWTLVCLLVVFPTAFVAGVQFPLLISLAGQARRQVARQVGQVYAANTLGSVAGSLAGGFGLMTWLTAPGVWRLAAGSLLVLGLGSLVLAMRRAKGVRGLGPGLIAAFVVWCLVSPGPSAVWRHSSIGVGRVKPEVLTPLGWDGFSRSTRRETVWEEDGVEVAVALNAHDGLTFVVNGRPDGNAIQDAATQVMGGVLGSLLNPGAKKALVIGLGTGSTAGWLASVPGISRVDVMELEPSILEVARRMSAVNQRVMENPKVHIALGDARELLATSTEKYDIIFSEPSNPYRAGIANLYTQEYYRTAIAHLEPRGLFIQWLQAYEVDGLTIQIVYATLQSVFGAVESWNGSAGDLFLIGSAEPAQVELERLRGRIREAPFAEALRVAWGVDSAEGVFAHHVAGPQFGKWLVQKHQPALNLDDNNRIEFGFARSVGATSNQFAELKAQADQFHAGRAAVPAGLDETLLGLERWLWFSGSRAVTGQSASTPDDESQARGQVAQAASAFLTGDLAGAEKHWPPDAAGRSAFERLVRVGASFRDLSAVQSEAEALRSIYSLELELLEAFAALEQRDEAQTLAHLTRAFVAHRSHPWVQSALLQRALYVASAAGRSPQWYRQLAPALSQPFSMMNLESRRLDAYLKVLGQSEDLAACAEAYARLGDNVLWTRGHLEARLKCFLAQKPGLAVRAQRDLDRLKRN